MFRYLVSNQKGQNLIEVLLALGIFVVFVSGSSVLVFRYFNTFLRAQEWQDVTKIGQESFEAVQSIAYNNWASMTNGTYGLSSTSGNWQWLGQSDVLDATYTRTVNITSVWRNTSCEIVIDGGNEDPDTKLVTLNLSWLLAGVTKTQSFQQYFTRWNQPVYCIKQAANLILDVSVANIGETKKSLLGVVLINGGIEPITLDKMTLTWDKSGYITYIKIENTNHWHASGIGSPSEVQPSGTELDLVDLVMQPGEPYSVDAFRFDSKMDGATFTITATMSDGSKKLKFTTPPFVP